MTPAEDSGHCRACGAPITWAVTVPKGHRMPLDPDVKPDGNVAVTEPSGSLVLGRTPRRARVLRAGETAGAQEWTTTSHHATCPSWRKR